jgi:L,D-peptidoglycan transpeptidase YkuD (ErfK/YbiS/YcfS/YnhG family)
MKEDLDSFQLIIVIAETWDSSLGKMYLYERTHKNEAWQTSYQPMAVTLGKRGLAWGRGLHLSSICEKQEGDLKSPAGIFSLPTVFGFAPVEKTPFLKMPYLQLKESLEAVDDSESIYYNQIVDRSIVSSPDWKSCEKMKEIPVYEWGIVIDHNFPKPIPALGSAIFFHLWREAGHPTAGCTAMSYENMQTLLTFVSDEKKPMLLQLPKDVYLDWQKKYQLPILEKELL